MRHKFVHLDGLRGFAALAVVWAHIHAAFWSNVSGSLLDRIVAMPPVSWIPNGDFSVTIFFVLSGFVLSHRYFDKKEFDVSLSVAKRYFRLAIPVLGAVFLAFLALRLGLFRNTEVSSITGDHWFAAFWQFPASFKNMLYQGLYGVFADPMIAERSLNPVLWTMRVELLGSMLVFGTLSIYGRLNTRGARILIYSALAIAFFRTNYLGFVLGMALADFHSIYGQRLLERGVSWVWLLVFMVGIYIGTGHPPVAGTAATVVSWRWEPIPVQQTLAYGVGAVLVMMSVLYARPLSLLLASKVSAFVGRISYAIYLVHFVVLGTVSSWVFLYAHGRLGQHWAFLLAGATTLVVSILAAWVFTILVDQPAIRLSAYFGKIALNPRPTIEALARSRGVKRIRRLISAE